MGLYSDRILPHCIDLALSRPDILALRERVTRSLHGTVLEVGFGSGLNLPYYPRAVTQVYALDPARFAQQRAAARIVARGLPVQWLVSPESDSGRLPLPDQSVDTALSTFTLCTIPRVSEALAELRRVLKPRGSLHFLEHGRAVEPFWAQIQDLLDPLRRPLVGGCHLNRAIDVLLRDAGFCLNELKTYAVSGPKLSSYLYEGVACACAKGAGTAQETGC